MIVAVEAAANCTSFSVMPPMPRQDEAQLHVVALQALPVIQSPPRANLAHRPSATMPASPAHHAGDLLEQVLELGPGGCSHRPVARKPEALARASPSVRARARSLATPHFVPACGGSEKPRNCTGVEGKRFFDVVATVVDQSLDLAPGCSRPPPGRPPAAYPCCTITVATGPRPASRLASSTTPRALAFDACSQLFHLGDPSRSVRVGPSILVPWSAETSTTMVSPPHASGTSPTLRELLEHTGQGRRQAGPSC